MVIRESLKRCAGIPRRTLRIFTETRCPMLAAGLTYYTIVIFVPLLCMLLVAAKAFNADDFARRKIHEQIEMSLARFEAAQDDPLAAVAGGDEKAREGKRAAARMLAAQARDIEAQVFNAIGKIDFKTLGAIGFLMLLWSVVGSIGTVETSFNAIWGETKGRPFWKSKLVDAGMALALPLLCIPAAAAPALKLAKDAVCAATGAIPFAGGAGELAAALVDSWPLRFAVSVLFAALSFAFVYRVLPARRPGTKTAFKAGLAAALLSEGWMKICAVAQVGISKSSALYGSLAFLPIVLAWTYMAWQIILLGCCIHRALDEADPARQT